MGNKTAISERFKSYSRAQLDALVNRRAGEIKLGELVQVLSESSDIAEGLESSPARFVLLGIPEDIGVRANGGVGGAHTAWAPALKALLNMQSTTACSGAEIIVAGAFDFDDWMAASLTGNTADLRKLVAEIDDVVAPLIQLIIASGKIPIVIGGGHNNAFPLLNGASMAKASPVNCINLDAHSDYRMQEGRHSGNGFRYAKAEGYLSRYAMVGLHEAYNSEAVVTHMQQDAELHFSFFEDIFLLEKTDFSQAVKDALQHTAGLPAGIELDLDCIAGVLASAATPIGIATLQARQYLLWCAQGADVAYLHIAEGAVQLRDGRADSSTAKLIACLVSDFIKAFPHP